MHTGKEKHLYFLSLIPVPHQDRINHMVSSNNYVEDCIEIVIFKHIYHKHFYYPPQGIYTSWRTTIYRLLQILNISEY